MTNRDKKKRKNCTQGWCLGRLRCAHHLQEFLLEENKLKEKANSWLTVVEEGQCTDTVSGRDTGRNLLTALRLKEWGRQEVRPLGGQEHIWIPSACWKSASCSLGGVRARGFPAVQPGPGSRAGAEARGMVFVPRTTNASRLICGGYILGRRITSPRIWKCLWLLIRKVLHKKTVPLYTSTKQRPWPILDSNKRF